MFKPHCFLSITIPFVLLCANAATAQTLDSLVTDSLREVRINANYSAAAAQTSSTLLAQSRIQNLNTGQDLPYILQFAPSVTVTSDAGNSNGYTYLRLRGIDQTRLNISLNGVPLNEPEDQTVYFSNFTDLASSLQSVEVQRGVGTSRSGVASFGGSIGMASPALTATRKGGAVFADYGSFNTARLGAELRTGLTPRGFSAYARASYSNTNGYKEHAGNTGASGLFSAAYFGKRDVVKLTALIGRQQNNGLAWRGVSDSAARADPRTNGNSRYEVDNFYQAHLQALYTHQFGARHAVNAAVYRTQSGGYYTFDSDNFNGLASEKADYRYQSAAATNGTQANYTYTAPRFTATIGGHASAHTRRHEGLYLDAPQYVNTGTKTDYSAFAKAAYTAGRFRVFADAQYRVAAFRYDGNVDLAPMQWTFFNPKIGVDYTANAYCKLYYTVGATGREPARNDFFAGSDELYSAEGFVYFQPERVQDHELGINYQRKNTLLKANLYYMQFAQEITLSGAFGATGLPLNTASTQSFRSGVELEAAHRWVNGWGLRHTSAFSYNQIQAGAERVAPVRSPTIVATQEVYYQRNKWLCATSIRYQSASYLDFANRFTLPAFAVINVSGQYEIIKNLTLRLTLNNITNQVYYSDGGVNYAAQPFYFVQAPLQFSAGARYSF